MLKKALIFSLVGLSGAIIATPAVSAKPDEEMRKIGDAISAGKYVEAEAAIARLNESGKMDAAMLINLGNAYLGMGRHSDARHAYQAALESGSNMKLDMADGSVRSVREVALDGLRHLGVSYASR